MSINIIYLRICQNVYNIFYLFIYLIFIAAGVNATIDFIFLLCFLKGSFCIKLIIVIICIKTKIVPSYELVK